MLILTDAEFKCENSSWKSLFEKFTTLHKHLTQFCQKKRQDQEQGVLDLDEDTGRTLQDVEQVLNEIEVIKNDIQSKISEVAVLTREKDDVKVVQLRCSRILYEEKYHLLMAQVKTNPKGFKLAKPHFIALGVILFLFVVAFSLIISQLQNLNNQLQAKFTFLAANIGGHSQPIKVLDHIRLLNIFDDSAHDLRFKDFDRMIKQLNKTMAYREVFESHNQEDIDCLDFDTVLVSVYDFKYRDDVVKFLKSCTELGVNIVIPKLSFDDNNWIHPQSQFLSPLIPGERDDNGKNIYVTIKDHPLIKEDALKDKDFSDYPSRYNVTISPQGLVDLVAFWQDGVPFIAIRHDMNGLITAINTHEDSYKQEDFLRIITRSLYLSKDKTL